MEAKPEVITALLRFKNLLDSLKYKYVNQFAILNKYFYNARVDESYSIPRKESNLVDVSPSWLLAREEIIKIEREIARTILMIEETGLLRGDTRFTNICDFWRNGYKKVNNPRLIYQINENNKFGWFIQALINKWLGLKGFEPYRRSISILCNEIILRIDDYIELSKVDEGTHDANN